MIVDTSAVVAILRQEPEAAVLAAALQSASLVAMSAATVLECALVLGSAGDAALDVFLTRVGVDIRSVDSAQLTAARLAHRTFGRGTGHPARLNFGDCFSYALATVADEPLLFKGDDFGRTDVCSAVLPVS